MKAKAATHDPFTFLLVGRAGVGKSSLINSLMDKEVATGHYEATTMMVVSYPHEVAGIKFKIVDTPGLCDDLEEEGNDARYLELIRSEVPEIDCLLYITRLDDMRVLPSEKRAIRLVSDGLGKDIWKHAVIVFTHANDVHYSSSVPPVEQYQSTYKERTSLIRKEIALWTDSSTADKVPSVAIDNRMRTTPDGKEWLGILYKETLERISGDAFVFFTGSMADRLQFGAQTSQNTTDNTSTYTGQGTGSIIINDPKTLVDHIGSALSSIRDMFADWFADGADEIMPEKASLPQPQLRHLHARLPQRAHVGERLPLQVRVALSPALDRSTPLRAFSIPPTGAELKLVLECPGLLLHTASIATVHVTPTADSDWVLFELEAVHEGVYSLEILAFNGGAFLGTLSLQLTVNSLAVSVRSVDYLTLRDKDEL